MVISLLFEVYQDGWLYLAGVRATVVGKAKGKPLKPPTPMAKIVQQNILCASAVSGLRATFKDCDSPG